MRNFSEENEVVTLTAPSGGVVAGRPYLIGSLVGVALISAAEGAQFTALIRGLVSYTKTASQAWTEGLKIYLDVSPREFTSSAGGNTLCGVAAIAVGSGAGGDHRLRTPRRRRAVGVNDGLWIGNRIGVRGRACVDRVPRGAV